MKNKHRHIWAVGGFICLFLPYHAAEISIRFYNNIPLFLGLMFLTIVTGYFIAKKIFSKSIFVFNSDSLSDKSRNLLAGIGVGLATYLSAYIISQGLSLEAPRRDPGFSAITMELATFTAGTLLPSLAEDVLTRAYVFLIWPKKYSQYAFVFFSSVVYVMNHIYALNGGCTLIIYLFITGISLAIPLVLTRSIWYTFGLHWACNIIYRVSNDIFQNRLVSGHPLSSLALLCIVVLCFIPVNILVIRVVNKNTARARLSA